MTSPKPDLRALAMLGIVMLLWSGNSIIGRAVRDEIPPFTLAFVRWTGALLILLPFAIKGLWADCAALIRAWKPVLILGITGVATFNAFLYSGLHHTTAANALLLQALIPALVLLFDFLFFRTRATAAQVLGVLVSTVGVAAIVFQGDLQGLLSLSFGYGDLLILCAVVVWSLYTVLLRLRPDVAPFSLIAVTFAIGAVAMAPLAASEWQMAAMPLVPAVIGAFAYVALLPSIVAYILYNAAVARIGAARAGQAITLMPLFGALLSALLLGEVLHGYHLVGMALILLGILASALPASRTRQ